jgi:hypothetical protein
VRKFFIRLAIFIALLITGAALWIFGGRQLSLLADRFGTIETTSTTITSISYGGSGSGGILYVNDLALGLNETLLQAGSPNVGTTKDGQLALSIGGQVFAFGPLRSSESDQLTTNRPSDDDASIAIRHSVISWPTPFEFNFMTGHSPSWKRHFYQRLVWKKSSGAKLEMLWRHEQYFYPSDGWVNGLMTNEGSTGLIRVDISNRAR